MAEDTGPTQATTNGTSGAEAAREVLAQYALGLGVFHLNTCLRCGLCNETCHIYLAEPEFANLPAVKLAPLIQVARRYHTWLGRHFPKLAGACDLTDELLDTLPEIVYGRCTACGRCALICPLGIDLRELLRVGRKMCVATGRVPEGIQRTVENQLTTGNQMAIPGKELIATAEWLVEDLQAEMHDETVTIPIDVPGKRILYLINPREVKFFPLSLMAAAGVFHAARESWTLSSKCFDLTNYAFFAGDDEAARELTQRVLREAEALGVKEIVLSECGHGFRAFHWEGPHWIKQPYPIPTRSVLDLLDEYLQQDRIKVDPSRNADRVTLHDPCNLVRLGGVTEPQRRILRRVVQDFVEMTPNRQHNYCCGGGGGMLSLSEYGERRIASGEIKADQIRATGAKVVASPCHNCADQLIELSKKHQLGTQIQALVELVYNALV